MKNANKPWNNMKHYIIMFLTIPVLYSCFDLDEDLTHHYLLTISTKTVKNLKWE